MNEFTKTLIDWCHEHIKLLESNSPFWGENKQERILEWKRIVKELEEIAK